ncbi:MAG TPA: DNA helicase, partial [Patescibacteria group bacterium]|nr:DNA helicase [Patescibacteria group bacterium]
MKQDSAFLLEQHHLDNTIQEMQHIVDCLQEDVTARDDQIRTARDRKEEISTYVHTMLQRDHHHKISDIQSSLPNPYFGRVDFREDATPEFHSYYIGRVKVNRPEINGPEDILVFDWRDPVSTVFYECEGGRASYQVLDRYHYHGDVRLKRQYKVEDGQLKTMVDDPLLDKLIALQQGGLNADPFLQERLLQGAGDKLRDIVTSIQSEQNKIIRDPLNQVTIIQGVAGSGKSTVGLHRLSYLLYNEKLDPGKLVIIAPNRIFLDYIGELLPNIDARGVRQWVWEDLTSIVTARTWDLAPDQRLNILLETGPEQKDRRDQLIYAARCKGSHEFMAVLDTYMAKKTEKYCLKLKDITLFDGRLHLSCRQQVDRFMADV